MYECYEKKVILTAFQNSPDCGLTPNSNTTVHRTEIALQDKCIKLGKGYVFYDCSAATPATRTIPIVSLFLLAVSILMFL